MRISYCEVAWSSFMTLRFVTPRMRTHPPDRARAAPITGLTRARTRHEQHDADVAASDADLGEAEAAAAIDYAGWAIQAAELAILDALCLRARALEKAAQVAAGA